MKLHIYKDLILHIIFVYKPVVDFYMLYLGSFVRFSKNIEIFNVLHLGALDKISG